MTACHNSVGQVSVNTTSDPWGVLGVRNRFRNMVWIKVRGLGPGQRKRTGWSPMGSM